MESVDRIRQGLADPAAFPSPPGNITRVETHISQVFLTDERVYKTKKPLRFPFLDYSTLEARRTACEEELRINRRLAPKVYLAVQPISATAGGLRIGDATNIVDYCVEMARLPLDRTLDQWIARHREDLSPIDRLLEVLVPFYEGLPRLAELARFGEPEILRSAVQENITTLGPLIPASEHLLLDRIRSSQWQYLTLAGPLFEERVRRGSIVEGHGDLRPEHVCLTEPPVVFDAVEFSLPFRCGDIVSELAFLAMECDYLGAPAFGRRLLEGYRARSGDPFPDSLANFYKSYRATVRAKVELLRAQQQSGEDAENHRRRFHRYLHLASAYASDFHRPVGILFVGVSGSGKSSLARLVQEKIGCGVLRTDAVRQQMAGRREPDSPMGQGIYAPAMTERTYGLLLAEAETLLKGGVSVVLDGTFVEPAHRVQARTMACQAGVESVTVWCQCPSELAADRVGRRRREGGDISDAPEAIVAHQSTLLSTANDLAAEDVLRLPMEDSLERNRDRVIAHLRHLGAT